ncbi:MAG TPA: HAD hydrolase family protein [Actinomycetes bacterium]|nr:HAD hydrolase family protein [Actinomycetes bacterium]
MTAADPALGATGVRVVYSDLDGTMVGPFGCFVRSADGDLTPEPAQALVGLLGAGVELVLVSGRTRPQLEEASRIFGADGFVAEMGAILGWDGGRRSQLVAGDAPPEFAGPLVPQLEALGLVDALLARSDGRLEHHAPWHAGHETDVMLRGQADVPDVNAWLASTGYPWLVLVDNGRLPLREMPGVAGTPHIYHLMSRGISKGRGIRSDLARRGLTSTHAVAVGDSMSDLEMAPHVRQFFLVANGAEAGDVREAAAALPNVTICAGRVGLGWAEAARWAAAHA